MASTTYTTAAQPAIGEALGELATATRHLLAAVVAKLAFLSAPAQRPATRAEEAAEARAMADRFVRFDPRMAADIYSAADRHEMGG
jgi:hypothetical protein